MAGRGFSIAEELVEEAEAVVKVLRGLKASVVTAESCTGGLIAAVLSRVPGVSDTLQGGFVVYTKEQKTRALGVPATLLEARGSVNAEVASQMVLGALERSPADIALAVTGVVGPAEDEDGNPPGQVYFAVGAKSERPEVEAQYFGDKDPDKVRHATVAQALSVLHRTLTARGQ